jgi:hypothetical protein
MTYDRRARLKFYHASPRRFRNGDILVGGQPGGFGYAGHMVSLTTEPYPHITIKSNAVSEDWFVYEVEPNDKIQFLRTDYGTGEYRTRSATVIRNLGKARAFVQHDPEYLSFSLPEKNERDRQYKKRQGLRVVARYHQAQMLEQDEGSFVVYHPLKYAEVVADIAAKMHKAISLCASTGIPIKDKLRVNLSGKGTGPYDLAAYTPGSNPPTLDITPKAYKRADLVQTLVHELGHYAHERVVPGGKSNQEIPNRFKWAVEQVQTHTPKKGEPFEFLYRGGWLDYSQRNRGYPMLGRIIGKGRNRNVRVQILKYPPEILDDPKLSSAFLTYPPLDSGRVPLEHPIVELSPDKLLYVGRQTEKDDASYEAHQHDWVPTEYSKKNSNEWFAELITTFVLGHLAKEPSEWLISVLKTGKA